MGALLISQVNGGRRGIAEILATVDREIALLQRVRALLGGSETVPKKRAGRPRKAAPAAVKPPKKNKRRLTPEGRRKIAEAVKRRWAAQKKAAAAAK